MKPVMSWTKRWDGARGLSPPTRSEEDGRVTVPVTTIVLRIWSTGGAIKTTLDAAQRGNVLDEMDHAMSNRSTSGLEKNIRGLPWFTGLKDKDKRAVTADRSLTALDIGLKQPWIKATDGGEHLGEHVYEESYENDWSRYRHEARSRMVSPYQFRQAPEWFAEAYAFYYMP